jgi:hypothetical protein
VFPYRARVRIEHSRGRKRSVLLPCLCAQCVKGSVGRVLLGTARVERGVGTSCRPPTAGGVGPGMATSDLDAPLQRIPRRYRETHHPRPIGSFPWIAISAQGGFRGVLAPRWAEWKDRSGPRFLLRERRTTF